MSNAHVLPEGPLVNRQKIPFETDGGVASRAAIGLIVLATDQTIEHEFRKIIDLPGVGLYETRLFNAPQINNETLLSMQKDIDAATRLIMPVRHLDVVAFGCTSGALAIGQEAVFAEMRKSRPDSRFTTPVAGAFAALEELKAKRIALLTAYRDDINQRFRAFFEENGIGVPVLGSFNEEDDTVVARITPASVREAVLDVGRHEDVDAVFVSCTSLRVAEHAAEWEAELGKPITSSNHAMAWHCLRLAGLETSRPQFGRLFA